MEYPTHKLPPPGASSSHPTHSTKSSGLPIFLRLAPSLCASYSWKILPPVGVVGNLFLCICWHLWISRNKLLFDNRSTTPQDVLLQSICAMKEWEAASPNRPTTTLISPPIPHLPRPSMISVSTTVCHTDASWKVRAAGLAWIFSDHAGTESSHKAISLDHVSSPLMAEALAIRGALLHATSIKITHICLRSDFQVLIQEICQRKLIMELYGVLSYIDSLSFSAVSPFVSLASDRQARGFLGGPVLQSSKPKGNSNSENMNRIWLIVKNETLKPNL
ncbi:hypothetical protein DY000_02052776 [Brassica cretica]|uniref:RNase H type-1 domain-containing protein n=1 Tax=Brassica cretica TaxID=69181 RepID=A0ABQ7AGV3_BRACR|nr:hypothetical protein DY000_02052776 [Brassica cretica]